jgi:hypothetical protein
MKKRKNLIFKGYRISESDDKKVKAKAKIFGGESAFIRTLIRGYGGGLDNLAKNKNEVV